MASILDRLATRWYSVFAHANGSRNYRQRVRRILHDRGGRKGLVGGRPTHKAGLGTYDASSVCRLLSRSYAGYDQVYRQLKHMRDYNPDAALAVWNFLLLCNQGAKVEVYAAKLGSEGERQKDVQGQQIIDELLEDAGHEYGAGLLPLANVGVLTLITQGAAAMELELSENLREVLDVCPVDPRLIDFAKDDGKYVPVINRPGKPERLNTNQFRYMPLHPDVGDPRGRSPLVPALETAFFQTEVMRDLKAVVHNQGYPRIEVTVLEEIILENVPAHLKAPGAEEALKTWLDNYLADLQTTFNGLHPDDAFIHWDWTKPGYVSGNWSAGSVDAKKLMEVIDTQMVAALKQLPILLGRNEGSTTTHATVQWQIYAAGIEALREHVGQLLSWTLSVALQVYGRQAKAEVSFEALRKADRKAEAEAEATETRTRILQVQAGWIDNDEAAQKAVGHKAVGVNMVPLAPVKAEPVSTEKALVAGARAAEQGSDLSAGQIPPSHIPDWLWARTRSTQDAYSRRWAEPGFAEKM
ncbi:MAG TPA: hypothetical protein VM537_21960, partial [Anaerolineae bacterium]|nr:hypothetical protein [Anaerolineae bacterium]